MKKGLCGSLGLVFFCLPVWGLTVNEVVVSSLRHYPQVLEALQVAVQQDQEVRAAQGVFDAKISGKVDARLDGYYSGDAYGAQIEKPLPFLNSRVYAGQRQSYGSFPGYEGKLETLDDGETFAGVSLSLLRNALIDQNRYQIWKKQETAAQAKIRVNRMKIDVQTMAIQAYWAWMVRGHELKVYEGILQLAQKRASNIRGRIRAGDLARIYAVENSQYIQKRKAQVAKQKLELQKAAFVLGLFYRDDKGVPRSLAGVALPALPHTDLLVTPSFQGTYDRAVAASLSLQLLQSKERQAELDVRLGRNDLLPSVDVGFEWSRDSGVGPDRLGQSENRVLLKVDVPLQFRKGLGKKRSGEAKIAQLKIKEQWVREKLDAKVRSLLAQITAFADIFQMTAKEVSLGKQLAQAERRKFSQGASDLILVNIREETFAEAQVKNLQSLLKYQNVRAALRQITVDWLISGQ